MIGSVARPVDYEAGALTQFERVFGRSRIPVSPGPHAIVFREAAAPGERRRYAKRFLATPEGDFRHWTARESRILESLGRDRLRCVPELAVPGSATDAMQTFDAGVTVEQWATLLRIERHDRVLPHLFIDCAHWWALAHHTLRALETLHVAGVVHLDLKPHHICIPALAADLVEPVAGAQIGLQFARLALIDFAIALAPSEPLASPFPISRPATYPSHSPRLLQAQAAARTGDLRAMQALDWRCDMFSLAAMLRHYFVRDDISTSAAVHYGWTDARRASASQLLAAIEDAHDRDIGAVWPHQALIEACEAEICDPELVASLVRGFALASPNTGDVPAAPLSPARVVQPSPNIEPGVPPLRIAAPVATTRSRWRLASAFAVVVLLCAAGVGVYLWDHAPRNAVTARADAPAVRAPAEPAVPDDRVASISTDRRSSELPADVATVQRAAAGESRDSPKAPPLDPPAPPATVTPSTPAPAPEVAVDTPVPSPRATYGAPTNPPVARPAVAPAGPAKRANAALPSRALEDVVARVETDAAHVLAVATGSAGSGGDEKILQGARSMATVTNAPRVTSQSPSVARQLNAQARAAWERQDVDTALRLQQRAFEAYPNDPEITGNLAFFYVKVKPAQPALARRLALYALAARGRTFPAGRMEDWGTLSVASSLDGRKADAIGAIYVMLATSKNPERACRAARMAVAQYGAPMQAPANALLSRVRARGGAAGAPSCR